LGMLQEEAVLSLVQYSIQNLLCVKAKMHALSFVSNSFFRILTSLFLPTVHPGAALTRKFLNAVGIPRLRTALAYKKEVMNQCFTSQSIAVSSNR
jgi:hypothetical protein